MNAQEIILPEWYKGQGNTIFHFSLLLVEWWIKNFILYKLQEKKEYMLGQILPDLKMALLQLPAMKLERYISVDETVLHICYYEIRK